MTFKQKIAVLFYGSLALAVVVIGYSIRETHLDSTQVLGVGSFVKVKFGYYQDCKGTVIKEVYSNPVTDRQGHFHPSIFAGYTVDLTCDNERRGDFFFSPDFLRVVRK